MGKIPPFATAKLDDDVDRFRRMSPEERLALFLELCDLTDGIVNGRPDAAALRGRTERSPEAEALWRRLMTRTRHGEHA